MPQFPENSSPFDAVFKALERSVSRARFKPYRKATSGKIEAVALYLWNVALCEALYPGFHFLEIALRTATYDAMREATGNRFWYDDPYLLEVKHQEQVIEAKRRLRANGKNDNEPPRVVAELSFGFWVNLFSAPYTSKVFVLTVDKIFPACPKRSRMQGTIYPILHTTLDFRNRVFHHEPIHHWSDLPDKHQLVQDVLHWVSPVLSSFAKTVDRFHDVYTQQSPAYHDLSWFTFMRAEQALIFPVVTHGVAIRPSVMLSEIDRDASQQTVNVTHGGV